MTEDNNREPMHTYAFFVTDHNYTNPLIEIREAPTPDEALNQLNFLTNRRILWWARIYPDFINQNARFGYPLQLKPPTPWKLTELPYIPPRDST